MKKLFAFSLIAILIACNTESEIRKEAQAFIDEYTKEYQDLSATAAEAEWKSNIEIIEGDTTNAAATRRANEAYARFTGSKENINKAKKFLKHRKKLTPLQEKQLETILYNAANNPETAGDIVKRRIKAETEQTEKLYGFNFKIDTQAVSPNQIDSILRTDTILENRLKAWNASKEVGEALKDGLDSLRGLRNKTVQALDYDNYFAYQISDYGMETKEMMELMDKIITELWPLYRELHTYTRYELARRYGVDSVPAMLPAHWLPNRWGQDWNDIVKVEGLDLDSIMATKDPEWIVKQGERFYMSLGFPALPNSFWEKSDIYPLPPDAGYKKNNHASAWHMNLDQDVRTLMSVEANPSWYETSHHELGHIYYYMMYSNDSVPLLLRGGANRGYHEALGSLMGLAAMQKPFLAHLDLLPPNAQTDSMQILLKEALNYVVFIPFSAGVMANFEHDLYAEELPKDKFNSRWWQYKEQYQGIVPPHERSEQYCDACSKTHINNDAAQYYDYAISYILLFQLHDHIAREILNQNPRSTNYYGEEEVGEFIADIMRPGATRDWRELLKEKTGEDLNAKAMLRYFEPLMNYLKQVNQGREYTLPEKPEF